MERLRDIFAQAGLRLTRPRSEVFQALSQAGVPLTASQLARRCPGVDRTSIYRILETFCQLNIVTMLAVGWRAHYELAEPFLPHHHHFICTHCRHATTLQHPEIEQLIQRIAAAHQFTVTRHQFELEGLCARCAQTSQTQPTKKR